VKARRVTVLNASLKELAAALARKKISSVELTQLFLNRIEKLNPSSTRSLRGREEEPRASALSRR